MFFFKLGAADTDTEVQQLFCVDSFMEMLDVIGYKGIPYKATLQNKTPVMQ